MENVKRIILLFVLTVLCLMSFQKNVYACPDVYPPPGSEGDPGTDPGSDPGGDPVSYVDPSVNINVLGPWYNSVAFIVDCQDGDDVSAGCSDNFTLYYGDGGSTSSNWSWNEYPDPWPGQSQTYDGGAEYQDDDCSWAGAGFSVTVTSPPRTYTIYTGVNNANYGYISPGGNVTVNRGESITISAIPYDHYCVDRWGVKVDGEDIGADATSYTFDYVTSDHTFNANFSPIQYTLTVYATNGTVSKSPNQSNYNSGSNVTLTATPASGYTFTSWSGDASGSTNPLTVTMNGNKNITANFAAILYTVTLSSNPTAGGNTSGGGTFNSGASVTVTATPNAEYTFTNWTENGTPVSVNASHQFTLSGNRTLVANFTASTYSFSDESGTVEICIWQKSSTSNEMNEVNCTVDADYVLIGGGAYVVGGYGLLTASYPSDNNLTTWTARSKDHLYVGYHTLICYAIGMKLKNVSRATLMNYMIRVTNESTPNDTYESTSVSVPDQYVLLGGGASVPLYAGQLLCQSNPSGGTTWTAAARAHGYYYTTSVTAYAIGIKPNISGFGMLDIRSYLKSSDYVTTGMDEVQYSPTSGYVLACIGGESTWNGQGRMLYELRPNTDNGSLNAIVGSKDHQFIDAGTTSLYICEIRNKPQIINCGIFCNMDDQNRLNGINAITPYGPTGQGWSGIGLGPWDIQADWDQAYSNYNIKMAILDRAKAVTDPAHSKIPDTVELLREINFAKTNKAQWIIIDDYLTQGVVTDGGGPILQSTMDWICSQAHDPAHYMQVAVSEDYTTVFNGNGTYLDNNWTFYQNVDIIMPYGYSNTITPSMLESFYNYFKSKGVIKIVPILGYNTLAGGFTSQKGSRSYGDLGFIESAKKYVDADLNILFYYIEPSKSNRITRIDSNWLKEWNDSDGGLRIYLDQITTYLRDQNYMIRTNGLPKSGIFISTEKGINSTIAKDFQLLQNYPNPFNPTTNLSYQLPAMSYISLKVYDMLGREVAILVDGVKDVGYYNATFDGSKLASGIYFVRFMATPQDGNQPFVKVMKMSMLK